VRVASSNLVIRSKKVLVDRKIARAFLVPWQRVGNAGRVRPPSYAEIMTMRKPGSGSITKRGDAWRLIVDAGVDPVTGKRRQMSKTVRGSRKDAEQAMAQLLTSAGRGDTHGHDARVSQLLDLWFERARLAPSTRVDYRSAMKLLPVPFVRTPVWKVRAHHVDELYGQLQRNGLSATRIRRVHNILRTAFAQAVRWQWIARNPVIDASPPPVPRADVRPPSAEQVRQLLEAGDGHLATYLRLSAHLAARRGEVCALQWTDVDLDGQQITIRRAWSDGGKGVGMVLKSTKSERERTIALDRLAVAMLRSWRAELGRVALEVGAPLGPWVFPADPLGVTAVRPDVMTHRFQRLRAGLGLDGVRLHDLRHFVATQLLAAGVDPRTVSGRLGHARTSTTLDIYAAFVPARDQDAADLLGRLLG
jgi:integrase